MEPRKVPFTYMFVAAFLVLVGAGVLMNRNVMQERWQRLTMQ
jgi:hypothetical protein